MAQQVFHKVDKLKALLEGKKFLLVHSASYERLEIKSFFDALPHAEFTGFTPNPKYEEVLEGVKLCRQERCTSVVAVGGGSAIDVAKCIKLFSSMEPGISYVEQPMKDNGISLIAVPTTAGTGSESTHFAVIYVDGEKYSVSHDSILPSAIVLDPDVLRGLPIYQKKCTMIDALSHAIESWWSIRSTKESEKYSQKAILLICENWEPYIFEDRSSGAVSSVYIKIQEAANLAGHAINITTTTAPHAMSYMLTSLYGIPHGHAVALCLPEVWNYMISHTQLCVDARGEKYLKNTLRQISEYIDINYFKNMTERLGLSKPRSKNKSSDVKYLSESVNLDRLKNNPTFIDSDAMCLMYEDILQDES